MQVQKHVRSPLYEGNDRNYFRDKHTGGDRMEDHGYADDYSRVLPDTAERIVEMGILAGSGLAVWSNIYPDAEIVGLDIDLSHFSKNREYLKEQGAFPNNDPITLVFDELDPQSWENLVNTVPLASVDVFIDDAMHDTETILFAFALGKKFVKSGGVYIIEDNNEVGKVLADRYPHYGYYVNDRFTAVKI